jgi:hypothetical protein
MVCAETLPARIFCNYLSMYGDWHIFRHGQAKGVDRIDFPPLVQDVESCTLDRDEEFIRPLWRRENAADSAGWTTRGRGRGGGGGGGGGGGWDIFLAQLVETKS